MYIETQFLFLIFCNRKFLVHSPLICIKEENELNTKDFI